MSRFIRLAAGGLLIAVAAGSYLYFNRPEFTALRQSTDDAYVLADFTNVASRVAGVVEAVLVEENQVVNKGDPLAILDDRDLRIAVQNAQAAIAVNEASIKTLHAQIERQDALIIEAQAAIASDDAVLSLARANEARMRELVGSGAVTKRGFDEAVSTLGTATATRDSHVAALNAARRQLDILNSQLDGARAAHDQAQASLADANLRLSYTRIAAPISGTVGQKAVRTGAYVTVGTTLLSIVPLDKLYVRANFRETQLARVRPGQSVRIVVDALPGQVFAGIVDSLGPASGVSYSAIAPQNATGNFTKVVQRLPIRIRIEPDQAGVDALRVGMSAVPEILIE
ncbi:UNVERIFIED_ORG: membrane fusion protein (multidrug efflux system) [Xanthobacter viscosus]|uniref:HlyD family secretion protein n=1 Tax=Xanthobacter autotrophicus TaxID=280 RepID=A0A6C1KAQ8_XANAU|nr:HlyD family secretion protein [Xanthobacter autotrophicus]TLX41389.1 HlyD family secretion protein [Xanthobacter autotrophicus]